MAVDDPQPRNRLLHGLKAIAEGLGISTEEFTGRSSLTKYQEVLVGGFNPL